MSQRKTQPRTDAPTAPTPRHRGYDGRGLHGEIVEALGRRIIAGEVKQGSTLDVAELEGELDVSRTVLREALRVLKAKGLVDARPKRGTFVRARADWRLLDPDVLRWRVAGRADDRFLNDLAELRLIVEPASARLAATRRTDDDLELLYAALTRMSLASGTSDEAIEADLMFHLALLGATHNELLIGLDVILGPGLASRDRLVHRVIELDDPTPAHAAVVDAVREGDAERAAQAAAALLEKSASDIEQALRVERDGQR